MKPLTNSNKRETSSVIFCVDPAQFHKECGIGSQSNERMQPHPQRKRTQVDDIFNDISVVVYRTNYTCIIDDAYILYLNSQQYLHHSDKKTPAPISFISCHFTLRKHTTNGLLDIYQTIHSSHDHSMESKLVDICASLFLS